MKTACVSKRVKTRRGNENRYKESLRALQISSLQCKSKFKKNMLFLTHELTIGSLYSISSLSVTESRKSLFRKAKGWKFERKLGEWEGFKDESQSEIGKGVVRQIVASRRNALGNCLGLRGHARARAPVCAPRKCVYVSCRKPEK